MVPEPPGGVADHRVECAGLLEQVMGVRHDHELVLAPQMDHRLAVELDHRQVLTADDQLRGRPDARQRRRSRKVGASAARDDSANPVRSG